LNVVDDRKGVLSDDENVVIDAAENICSLNLHHPDIAFRLIIIKRNVKIVHKG